jgi:hypothetical protein
MLVLVVVLWEATADAILIGERSKCLFLKQEAQTMKIGKIGPGEKFKVEKFPSKKKLTMLFVLIILFAAISLVSFVP